MAGGVTEARTNLVENLRPATALGACQEQPPETLPSRVRRCCQSTLVLYWSFVNYLTNRESDIVIIRTDHKAARLFLEKCQNIPSLDLCFGRSAVMH